MKVIIDLSGIKTEDDVLLKLGEVFEFGGPDGNIPVQIPYTGKGWGMNWDAVDDSLLSLEEGGIWGTSKRFSFPLEIEIRNGEAFAANAPERFKIFQDVFRDFASKCIEKNKRVTITFVS